MTNPSRQFEGTRDGDSIRITQASPLGERNMVKFNKNNPVHKELIRSIGEQGQPWHRGTMKEHLGDVALHEGGYFSTPKAPSKNLNEGDSAEAVARPKRKYTKKTTKASTSKTETAKPKGVGHKRAPKPQAVSASRQAARKGKGKGGIWSGPLGR